jgi:RES domain-containing protein
MSDCRRGTAGRVFQSWRLAGEAGWEAAQRQPKAGRWHYAGAKIIYASRTLELAVLETLAHHRAGDGPYWIFRITGPVSTIPECVTLDQLPADWRKRASITRAIGNEWLASRRTALLCVPSAVCTTAFNILLNPALASPARWRLTRLQRFRFDRRLVRR